MKLALLTLVVFTLLTPLSQARTVKEVIYQGKVDPNSFRDQMIVSRFYEVGLQKENDPSFQYKLRQGLNHQAFNGGIYRNSGFTLAPSINSKLAMALRVNLKQTGPIRIQGEKGMFDTELSIENTKIGSARFEFDLYSLPIRRVYNPKVKQLLESTGEGYSVVEIREID